jgi:hypothetical protein
MTFGESCWCSICACGCSIPHIWALSVHLATDVECGFVGDQSFSETIFLHFQLHLLAKFMPFHFVCWCKGCTNRILYGLKQPLMQHLPHRHFWHAQFPACSSH